MKEIETFQSQLDENEELAVFVIGGPAGSQFFPTQLHAINPDKILFGGLDVNEKPFMVVQHVSQLNFSMQSVEVPKDQKPRRIGFEIPGEQR